MKLLSMHTGPSDPNTKSQALLVLTYDSSLVKHTLSACDEMRWGWTKSA